MEILNIVLLVYFGIIGFLAMCKSIGYSVAGKKLPKAKRPDYINVIVVLIISLTLFLLKFKLLIEIPWFNWNIFIPSVFTPCLILMYCLIGSMGFGLIIGIPIMLYAGKFGDKK